MSSPKHMSSPIPILYPILDVDLIRRSSGDSELIKHVVNFAVEFAEGGATILQYRAKSDSPRTMLAHARELHRVLGGRVRLIMNDRADLCLAAAFDGVHVGQEDMSPSAVRGVVGPTKIVGVSTHNLDQLRQALGTPSTYIAIGPVFATGSKLNPDPVVGIKGVSAAKALMREVGDSRPLVAIGGITRGTAREVHEAGADCIAVISDLFTAPRTSVEEFLKILV